MALAFITSYIKIWNMPWGGSVTLCSMLFIVLVANWYGAGTGIFVGLAYGILQFIQEPYVLSFFRCAVTTYWRSPHWEWPDSLQRKNTGCSKATSRQCWRGALFMPWGGYLYWMDYMPENFPQSLKSIYPIAYNYSYLLVEAVITIVIISIPAVAKGLNRVKQTAVE